LGRCESFLQSIVQDGRQIRSIHQPPRLTLRSTPM
jgi:hypothetical protein